MNVGLACKPDEEQLWIPDCGGCRLSNLACALCTAHRALSAPATKLVLVEWGQFTKVLTGSLSVVALPYIKLNEENFYGLLAPGWII